MKRRSASARLPGHQAKVGGIARLHMMIMDIKKMAKAGQMDAVKIMAKVGRLFSLVQISFLHFF